MFRIVLAALALFCFAAPAGGQAPSAPAATAAAKPAVQRLPAKTEALAKSPGPPESGRCQLGIIPIVGILFQVQKIGFTIFGNEYHRVRVDDWAFDDLVVSRVRTAAPGQGVRRILFARDELARHRKSGSLFRNINAELKDFVQHVSAGANCERYIVVHLHNSEIFNSYEVAHGMGIINVASPIQRRTYLFALSYIRIYDGQTFEILKQGAASTGDEPLVSFLLRTTPFRGPKQELDEAAFPTNPADAATNPTFREGVRALLKASLDKTLPALLAQ
jgi:hypothetical protein